MAAKDYKGLLDETTKGQEELSNDSSCFEDESEYALQEIEESMELSPEPNSSREASLTQSSNYMNTCHLEVKSL